MLRQFYGDVLPEQGCYCLTLLPYGDHIWADSLDELVTITESRINEQGLYFATASYQSFVNRKQSNVLALKALRLDIDAGPEKLAKHGEDAVYATQRDALAASLEFFRTTGITPTYVISSGAGLHIYYCLSESIEPAQWLRMAKALSALGTKHGLKIDPSVTEDSARILRVPGAPHPNGKRVEVLRRLGVIHSAEELGETLGVMAAPRVYDMSVNDDLDLSFQGPPSSALKIAQHCGAVREVAESKGDVQEPYWRAMIGVVKRTVEALDIAQEWSSGYEGYDPDEVERKFHAWATGPTTCQEFSKHTKACQTCPHRGKVKSPINLGLMTAPEIQELPEEQLVLVVAPAPAPTGDPWDDCIPGGFSVETLASGKKALVMALQTEKESPTGDLVPVVQHVPFSYSIFWFSQWAEAEGSDDTAQVILNLWAGTHVKRYTMDQSLVASQFKLLEYLSGKAIHTTTHKKAAQAMQDYAKGQLQHIHAQRKNLKVTDRLGLRTLDSGELICAHGKYSIFPDGTIRETMLSSQLRPMTEAFLVPVPDASRDNWGPEVWDDHIIPLAKRHAAFLQRYYGAVGMEKFQLAIMMSMASPFMTFVTGEYSGGANLPNNSSLTVSLFSRETARGKTTAAQSAILAYGRPAVLSNDSGKAGATVNGRLGMLSLHGTLPSIMDEMGDLSPGEVATTVSSVANGAGKRTMTNARQLRQESTWALTNIITSNVSQRDMVAAARSSTGAVLYRLLEIDVDGMPEFDAALRASFRDEWADVNRECAGALGAVIHREICKLGVNNMLKLVTRCVSRAEQLIGATQSARFQSRGLGAMIAMNLLLKGVGIAVFDVSKLVAEFKIAYDINVEFVEENTLPQDNLSLLSMALLDMAPNTIVTHDESWGRTGGQDRALNVKFPDPVVGRHVLNLGRTYLSVDALKEWCREKGVSIGDITRDAKSAGVLVPVAVNIHEKTINRGYVNKSLTRGMATDMTLTCRAYTFNTRRLATLTRAKDAGFELVEDAVEPEVSSG